MTVQSAVRELHNPPTREDGMSHRLHEDWLRAYLEYTKHSEAPDKFHFWAGVSAIAGALRRKVWLDMGYFQWTPNFYVVFVAPPGVVQKSTTSGIAMQLLKEVPDVNFGPDSLTWQSLIRNMSEIKEEAYIHNEGIYIPMSCVTIAASEFGTFLNPQNTEMVDVLVDLWDGKTGAWKKTTNTQGDDIIENPWINLIAGTTPSWIAGNMPDYMIGGGFTSRCVFVYGERKRHLCAYPMDHVPSDFEARKARLITDLKRIANLSGPFTLTAEAKEWGTRWYEEHHQNVPVHLNNERFGGYLARKQTHIHKLAMVLSAAKRDNLVINKDDLEASNAIVTALERDMPRVFDKIGNNENTKYTKLILETIKNHRVIAMSELYKQLMSRIPWKEFEPAMAGLISSRQIVRTQRGQEIYLLTPEELERHRSGGA